MHDIDEIVENKSEKHALPLRQPALLHCFECYVPRIAIAAQSRCGCWRTVTVSPASADISANFP
jgi:hypothetical protein